jgi:hypothetical protein
MSSSRVGYHQKATGELVVFDDIASGQIYEAGAAEESFGGLDLDAAANGLPDIGDLTDIGTAEDESADWLLIYDNDAATWKKVLAREYPQVPNYDNLTGSSVALGDLIQIWDITAGYNKRVAWTDIYQYQAAFRAYRSGDQVSGSNTAYKIPLNAESFDVRGKFDSSTNYRYTPDSAGYYLFSGCMTITAPNASYITWCSIYKNGAETGHGYRQNGQQMTSSDERYLVTDMMYMNGSTDYVELYKRTHASASLSIGGGSALETFLIGHKVG